MRVVLLLVLAVVGCAKKETPAPNTKSTATTAPEENPFRGLKELSVDDVEQRLAKKDGKTFVFDANPKEVFDKKHVPGAVFVPDEGVTASLLPPDKSATLIFYCANPH